MAINKTKLMDSARKFGDKGQTDKAIKEYLRVVEEDPKDVRVWLKIGDLYVKKGAKDEATETYLKVAKFYGEQGFYLKAVAVYKQILKLDPRLVEVNLKLAELYRQLGLMSDAMQHFEMVAAHFHREGKTNEALATIRQLVDLDPENVATRIKLAELYSKEGAVEDAVREFSQACDFLKKQGRTDDYIKVAERLLWHQPENLPLNRELATIYIKRNDARRALQKLQTCFKANPRDLETLAQLAQAFQSLDQKAKTVSVLKEMAKVLIENGQRAQAEDVHRKILVYAPSDPDSRAFLGEPAGRPAPAPAPVASPARAAVAEAVLAAAGPAANKHKMTGALPIPPEALADAPSARKVDDDFINELALDDDAAFEAESSVRGEAHAEEIVKILTEADVYVKYGLHQKAVDHLRKVFELDPVNLEARERLKDILLAQGREADAIAELMRMAEQCVAREAERATAYLREVVRIDAGQRRAFELAERFNLDLTDGAPAGLDDGGGLAPAPDEVGFDDLDLDGGGAPVGTLDGRTFAPGYAEGRAAAPASRAESDGFEFELDDDSAAPAPATGGTGTMEVSLDQVEDAVSVAELDGDDLDFDAVAPSDPLAVGAAEPAEFEFDPDDARAFDADRPRAAPVAAYQAQAEPVADEFEAPPFDPDDARAFDAAPVAAHAVVDDEVVEELDEDAVEAELDGYDEIEPDATPVVDPVLAALVGAAAHAPAPLDPTRRTAVDDDVIEDLGGAGPTLEDDLDEADFFVGQGLMAEAREILAGLLRRHPNHPLVAAKLRDLDGADQGLADEPLLGDLDEVLGPDLDSQAVPTLEEPARPRASAARPAVMLEKPLEDSDADTHFDLGLAYREMGLFDEAIKAFGKVRQVGGREVQSHIMIGMCHRDQGNLSEAINQFKAGLYVERITAAEKFGLYYEIGSTYEQLDDPQEALYYHEMVYKKDPTYRDVTQRVTAIRVRMGGAPTRTRPNTLESETDAALDQLLDGDGRG